MQSFQIRNLIPADIAPIVALQQKYALVYPGARVIPGEVYLSPGFHHGQNIFCGVDDRGQLRGYAPLFANPAPEGRQAPYIVWAEVKVDPELQDPEALRDLLFERVLDRCRETAPAFPGHEVQVTFQYYTFETASIAYVMARGCIYSGSIYHLKRDLSREIPQVPQPAGVTVRCWRMEREIDQQAYVQAHNEAFSEAPMALADWQYFLQSPQWAVGTTVTAFDDGQVVGSVAVFWDEAENAQWGKRVGYTEYIFVRPGWRRRGIARYLVREGLMYLKGHGLEEAWLEVRAENRQGLGLYERLGYEIEQESKLYVLKLE